jgi:hypothetical protein
MTRWPGIGWFAAGFVMAFFVLATAEFVVFGPIICWFWYSYVDPVVLGWAVVLTPLAVLLAVGVMPATRRWPRLRSWAQGGAVGAVLLIGLGQAADRWLQPVPSEANQIQNVASPSGKYVLSVPIARATYIELNGQQAMKPIWRPTIADRGGTVLYADAGSRLLGYYNVYWLWDAEDRAWLYNSDDGCVYFWELKGGQWQKVLWDRKKMSGLCPPVGLNHVLDEKERPE